MKKPNAKDIISFMVEKAMQLKKRDAYVVPIAFLFRSDESFDMMAFPDITINEKHILRGAIKQMVEKEPTDMVLFLSDSTYREVSNDGKRSEKRGAIIGVTLERGNYEGKTILFPYRKNEKGDIVWDKPRELKTAENNIVEPWGLSAA